MQDIFTSMEFFLGMKIPNCVKTILIGSGYDNKLCLDCINKEKLKEIENFARRSLHDTINNLSCCHSESYKSEIQLGRFEFIPGHSTLILKFPAIIAEIEQSNQLETKSKILAEMSTQLCFWEKLDEVCSKVKSEPAFSILLKEFIQTALTNFEKLPNSKRYSEVIKYFSIYIYILCGRNCYEILSSNLPMPASSTVCTFFIHPIIHLFSK